ncbi:unnamed protein product [Ectocarpus sp. 6 AP-2014]
MNLLVLRLSVAGTRPFLVLRLGVGVLLVVLDGPFIAALLVVAASASASVGVSVTASVVATQNAVGVVVRKKNPRRLPASIR